MWLLQSKTQVPVATHRVRKAAPDICTSFVCYLQFASAGSMTLRYQIDPNEPLTFMDVKVGKQVRNQSASTWAFPCSSMGHALPADHAHAVAYRRAMLHKLELATSMWPTNGVHSAAFL